ncbi:DNA-binding protein [Ruminococcus flavefaciens]|uniref:Fic family protein n=1 Tax=Ruminococcus flavefaciens TaxID=1265 RepID=UPI0026F34DC6|nr:DNA-binding protein [Ruminococcus flavefaciens]
MKYRSVAEMAELWGISERTVRNYCAEGRIDGAGLIGKTWKIPADTVRPGRRKLKRPETLLEVLREQKSSNQHGGIYHKLQIELTYNSNHIEGSKLTHDQTRYIFETNTLGFENEAVNVDDIVETVNHFRCIDYVIENAEKPLTEAFIKELHKILKTGTADSRKEWFAVGRYKKFANEVGGEMTAAPDEVPAQMKKLVLQYNDLKEITLEDIIDFHYKFESIHPFQDGNGRVGRLIMLKECLSRDIVPFIISDDLKMFYYRRLKNWEQERGWLTDTVLTAQDRFKAYLDYFQIRYQG